MIQLPHTRFERARIIGARALQLSMGAPPLLDLVGSSEPIALAISEFESGRVPLHASRLRDALD